MKFEDFVRSLEEYHTPLETASALGLRRQWVWECGTKELLQLISWGRKWEYRKKLEPYLGWEVRVQNKESHSKFIR